ncbi:MAG: hypothetical protein PHV95_10605 [Eubacteriales bacterium]|nr:hypothetical protein [Eubacteriales bacterium]
MKKFLILLATIVLGCTLVSCKEVEEDTNNKTYYKLVVGQNYLQNEENDLACMAPYYFKSEDEFLSFFKDYKGKVPNIVSKFIRLNDFFPDYKFDKYTISWYEGGEDIFYSIKGQSIGVGVFYLASPSTDVVENIEFIVNHFVDVSEIKKDSLWDNSEITGINFELVHYDAFKEQTHKLWIEDYDGHKVIKYKKEADYPTYEIAFIIKGNYAIILQDDSPIYKDLEQGKTAIPILENIEKAVLKTDNK